MRVYFIGLGRDKVTWSEAVPAEYHGSLEDWMYRAVRARGALRSQDIEFVPNDDDDGGMIYVGAVRCVGKYKLQRPHGECGICGAPVYKECNDQLLVCSKNDRHVADVVHKTFVVLTEGMSFYESENEPSTPAADVTRES